VKDRPYRRTDDTVTERSDRALVVPPIGPSHPSLLREKPDPFSWIVTLLRAPLGGSLVTGSLIHLSEQGESTGSRPAREKPRLRVI
jgi:hypothetical protein